jgi:lipoprotein NlpD
MTEFRAMVWLLLVLALSACATTNNAPVVDRSTPVLTPAAEVPPVEAEHTVAPGDTLYGIAFRHGLDYRRLAAWNAIAPPFVIRPGQRLRLGPPPGARGPDFSDVASEPAPVEEIAGTATTHPAPEFSDVAHGQLEGAEPATAVTTVAPTAPQAPSAAGPVGTFAAQETEAPVVVDNLGAAPPTPSPAAPTPRPVAPSPPPPTPTPTPTPTQRVPAAPPAPTPVVTPSAPATPVTVTAPTNASTTAGQVLPTGPTRAVAGITWNWPARGNVVGRFIAGDLARQGIDISGTAGSPVQAAADGEVVYSGNGLIGYGELVIIKHSAEFLSAYGHNSRRLVKEGDRVKAGQVIAEMGRSASAQDMLHFEVRRGGRPSDPLQYLPPR